MTSEYLVATATKRGERSENAASNALPKQDAKISMEGFLDQATCDPARIKHFVSRLECLWIDKYLSSQSKIVVGPTFESKKSTQSFTQTQSKMKVFSLLASTTMVAIVAAQTTQMSECTNA